MESSGNFQLPKRAKRVVLALQPELDCLEAFWELSGGFGALILDDEMLHAFCLCRGDHAWNIHSTGS